MKHPTASRRRPCPLPPSFRPRLVRPGAALTVVLALAVFSAGCVTRDFQGSKLDPALTGNLPEHWTAANIRIPDTAATGWLADFDTPVLLDLARSATGENYDLAATAARVKTALARAKIANADRLPQFEANQTNSRSQNLRGSTFTTVTANVFSTGLDLSWEFDLWGRVANLRKAALKELDAADADYQAARLSLAATVARAAIDLVEAKRQADLSRENLKSLQTNLDILDRKLEAGDADDRTPLDISLSRADVARARSAISQQEQQADAARRFLETLLGRYPEGEIEALTDLPAVKRGIPAGLPSELLLRRPDLVAAEARIDARFHEVAAARKALLPGVRITGSAGTSTTREFADLFDIRNLVWNIGNGLAQPVFEGGRLLANVELSEAARDEAAHQYAEAALTAFREVETALAAERYYGEQQTALAEAVEEAGRAEELSRGQYERGLVDIITLLESQRRAFDARAALLQLRADRLRNRVDLHLALGGDFDSPPETP